jgi:predicted SprT family Zn-dependent metalloprotease
MRRITQHFMHLAGFSLLIACQPATPQSSSLDHTLGQTTRARSALSPCTGDDPSDPVIGYMQMLVNELVTANSGTFQGLFDPSHFCLKLKQDDEINGLAYINNGEIHLTKGLIRAAESDADIAAVLAHELAHITMDHRYEREHEKVLTGSKVNELQAQLTAKQDEYRLQKANYYSELIAIIQKDLTFLDKLANLKSSPWLKYSIADMRGLLSATEPSLLQKAGLIDDLNNVRGQLDYEEDDKTTMESDKTWISLRTILSRSDQELKPIQDSLADLNRKLNELPRDELIGDGPGAAKNWKEQEADEVGYEFYLRAGFRPDRFTQIHNILMAQSRSDSECEALLSSGQLPARGFASHPSSCWRIHNINQRETMAHAEAYKPYMNNAKVSVADGKLEEIQAGL